MANRITDLIDAAESMDVDHHFGLFVDCFLTEFMYQTGRPIIPNKETRMALQHLYERGYKPDAVAVIIAKQLGYEVTGEPV